MCFSAEASFGSGIVLSVAGSIALYKVKKPSQIMFAAIPFLFSIQQFAEGFVWTAFRDNAAGWWLAPASYTFLVFALLIWPVWVPLSVWLIEKDQKRRIFMLISLGCGILLSGTLFFFLLHYPVNVNTNHYHIEYSLETTHENLYVSRTLYIIATVVSLLVSKIKSVKWLGLVILTSYLVSLFFFYEFTISIWCFFAAIASIMIIYIMKEINMEK